MTYRPFRHLAQAADPGFTLRHLALLEALAQAGEPTHIRDAGRMIGVPPPIITRAANALCARGLMTRLPDPADRRGCKLQLTDAGAVLVRRCQAAVAA